MPVLHPSRALARREKLQKEKKKKRREKKRSSQGGGGGVRSGALHTYYTQLSAGLCRKRGSGEEKEKKGREREKAGNRFHLDCVDTTSVLPTVFRTEENNDAGGDKGSMEEREKKKRGVPKQDPQSYSARS